MPNIGNIMDDTQLSLDVVKEHLSTLDDLRRELQQNPGNVEAARRYAALVVSNSRREHGWRHPDDSASEGFAAEPPGERGQPDFDQNGSAAPPLAGQSPASAAAVADSELKRTPLQALEAAIRNEPAHAEPYLELAALYLARGRDYDAERLLARGREATAGDGRVLERWEDVVMLRLDKKVAAARHEAEAVDSPQSRAALEQARSERDRIQTEIYSSRCQRNPGDAAARLQLGLRLKRAGKLREAIASLRRALASTDERCPAALAAGECHEELHEIPEALQHYRMAAAAAILPGQRAPKELALFDAARLAAGMGLRRLSQRYLAQLFQLAPAHDEGRKLLARLANER